MGGGCPERTTHLPIHAKVVPSYVLQGAPLPAADPCTLCGGGRRPLFGGMGEVPLMIGSWAGGFVLHPRPGI